MDVDKLNKLKDREKRLAEQLRKKRLELGGSDGPMFSRYPTGRAELESDMQVLEAILADVKKEIEKIQGM